MISAQKLQPKEVLRRKLERLFCEGVRRYNLIEAGDRVLVAVSGGKDSLALLELMAAFRRRRGNFEVEAMHVRLDNVDYAADASYLRSFADALGVPLHVVGGRFEPDAQPDRTPCFLCAWTRRKLLFDKAQALGCNKLAFGHHEDDLLTTALMNLTFNGTFATMPARLQMRKFPLTIIRPLCRIPEADLREWAQLSGYAPQQKTCPFERDSKRSEMASIFGALEAANPEARYNLRHALEKAGKMVE